MNLQVLCWAYVSELAAEHLRVVAVVPLRMLEGLRVYALRIRV